MHIDLVDNHPTWKQFLIALSATPITDPIPNGGGGERRNPTLWLCQMAHSLPSLIASWRSAFPVQASEIDQLGLSHS